MNGEMALAIAPRAAYDGGMPDLLQRLLDRVRPGLPPGTDAFRLSDGSPWEGVFVDVLADRVLVSTRDRAVPRELLDALRNARICAYRKRLERGRKSPPVQVSGPDLPPASPSPSAGCSTGSISPPDIPKGSSWTSGTTAGASAASAAPA